MLQPSKTTISVYPGFTLAELLIALAILGVIATFTIPKVLNSSQSSEYNSKAKEAAAMVSHALQMHRRAGRLSATTTSHDLTQYLNYIRVVTNGELVDDVQTYGNIACSTLRPCIRLHNGGVLLAQETYFDGEAPNHFIVFNFDPDGHETIPGSSGGPGKSVAFLLYYNGRITTYANMYPNSTTSWGVYASNPDFDPPWFSW